MAEAAPVGSSTVITVRAHSRSSGVTAQATALTEVASATFRRALSGPDVIGSRAPPERLLEMRVTVSATAGVSALVDYVSSSWTLMDARVVGGQVLGRDRRRRPLHPGLAAAGGPNRPGG